MISLNVHCCKILGSLPSVKKQLEPQTVDLLQKVLLYFYFDSNTYLCNIWLVRLILVIEYFLQWDIT